MEKYLVNVYNEYGCEIDQEVVEARDEEEAIEKYCKEFNAIIYSNDSFKARKYWD